MTMMFLFASQDPIALLSSFSTTAANFSLQVLRAKTKLHLFHWYEDIGWPHLSV